MTRLLDCQPSESLAPANSAGGNERFRGLDIYGSMTVFISWRPALACQPSSDSAKTTVWVEQKVAGRS